MLLEISPKIQNGMANLAVLLKYLSLRNCFIYKQILIVNNLKHECKISLKNQGYIIACLTIVLLGVVLFNAKFPALRNELKDTLLSLHYY